MSPLSIQEMIQDDWQMLRHISKLLNEEQYKELEKIIVPFKDQLSPIVIDALTLLPVKYDKIQKHKSLYENYLEVAKKHKEHLGLIGIIRIGAMEQLLTNK